MTPTLAQLRQEEYDLRRELSRLEQELHQSSDPAQVQQLLKTVVNKQEQLNHIDQQRIALQSKDPHSGVLLQVRSAPPAPVTRGGGVTRGVETTGLTATVRLKMAQVPTAIYHLLDQTADPLIVCEVKNSSSETRRLRITSYIEGYTAHAIETREIEKQSSAAIQQLPTFFPERIQNLSELTRATLNVLAEDLDGKVELHKTEPVWLLARNSATLYVRNPATGGWNDLTRYLGAFVTPNAPSVMEFLRQVADHHPLKQLFGYQPGRDVTEQVRAIFAALQEDAKITYVNSTVTFNPEQSASTQRVRLPRQSLKEGQANCLDGTLLFASLLEAVSLSPAIVIIPNHAFVAWERAEKSDEWDYLETTMIGSSTFEQACEIGNQKAKTYQELAAATHSPMSFNRISLRDLRTGTAMITPLE